MLHCKHYNISGNLSNCKTGEELEFECPVLFLVSNNLSEETKRSWWLREQLRTLSQELCRLVLYCGSVVNVLNPENTAISICNIKLVMLARCLVPKAELKMVRVICLGVPFWWNMLFIFLTSVLIVWKNGNGLGEREFFIHGDKVILLLAFKLAL